jgi:hypothetical protein
MSAWYSNIVGATTTKISNLQRSLLNSEADGDTEDDTHVCRVLRTYYTEKGKPFPGWLPPDPKAPPPVQPVYAQPSQVGNRYGGLSQQQPQSQGGGLSSLWDSNPGAQQQDTQSLRRGRGVPQGVRANDPRSSPFRNSDPMGGVGREDVQARPLPSQRAGSHQNSGMFGRDTGTAPPTGSAGGSAQDRLKQRLWGGSRTASPSSGGPFNPPSQQGGARGGNYSDPQGGGDRPYMSSNSPWAADDGGYGGSGGRSAGRRPGGLPSGPRMR